MSETDVWKDAPEGTEFIVEFTDGEIHYYKNYNGLLMVCVPSTYDEVFIGNEVCWWKGSMFDSLQELMDRNEEGRKQIHHKQN